MRFPERILECPEHPLVRTLRGDGQKSQVDGHTGRNARLGKGHGGMWDTQNANPAPGPHETAPTLWSCVGKSAFPGGPVPRVTLLRVATPVVQVRTPLAGLVEDVRQPSTALHDGGSNPMMPTSDRAVVAVS